jgi:hypothetical protein
VDEFPDALRVCMLAFFLPPRMSGVAPQRVSFRLASPLSFSLEAWCRHPFGTIGREHLHRRYEEETS